MVAGCSFSATCGFSKENLPLHWVRLLSNHYSCQVDNIAIDGASNDEIYYRTIEALNSVQRYDLVIVQWTSIGRQWIYFDDNNIDDFTMINFGNIAGLLQNRDAVDQYARLHYSYFNNQYMNLKKWLLQILSLQTLLKDKPFVFVKGFDNFLSDFSSVEFLESGFKNIDAVKRLLDFKNRPDAYIADKVKTIQRLIEKIDKYKWVNFDSIEFSRELDDLADDKTHPGSIGNKKLFLGITDYCTTNNILL